MKVTRREHSRPLDNRGRLSALEAPYGAEEKTMDNVVPLHPSPADRVIALAHTFPSLARQGVENVSQIRAIADSDYTPRARRFAARFVISVVDGGAFDLHKAWEAWDDEHCAAYDAWSANKWWA